MEKRYVKIAFPLTGDAYAYPPDAIETLWACEKAPGLFSIDNIPIFVKGISCGDVVSATGDGEVLDFVGLAEPSNNSVFRVYVFDEFNVKTVREELLKLGCESELSHVPNLIAVEIPGDIPIGPFLRHLMQGSIDKRWDYEEASLRHTLQ